MQARLSVLMRRKLRFVLSDLMRLYFVSTASLPQLCQRLAQAHQLPRERHKQLHVHVDLLPLRISRGGMPGIIARDA
jgi:hypothetical protein